MILGKRTWAADRPSKGDASENQLKTAGADGVSEIEKQAVGVSQGVGIVAEIEMTIQCGVIVMIEHGVITIIIQYGVYREQSCQMGFELHTQISHSTLPSSESQIPKIEILLRKSGIESKIL